MKNGGVTSNEPGLNENQTNTSPIVSARKPRPLKRPCPLRRAIWNYQFKDINNTDNTTCNSIIANRRLPKGCFWVL